MVKGLDEEQLTIFDLLVKADLSKEEVTRIKAVAVELLKILKQRLSEVQNTFANEGMRDDFRQTIYDYLWSDSTGLPADQYTEEDIDHKTDAIFSFFYAQSSRSAFEASAAN